jgi:hypothetical protein
MGNLRWRLEELERKKSMAGESPIVLIAKYGSSDGNGNKAYLTSEEEAALEEYKEKMTAAAAPGSIVAIYWTPEKARELLAQNPKTYAES